MSLREYHKKRRFDVTAEPKGREPKAPPKAPKVGAGTVARRAKKLAFVIQKHRATALHYDLRLEWNGVMLSWAVPRGPSLDPTVKRMAMQVEDHPIEYNKFEGIIPEGEYGGGTVMIWDRGTWTPESPDVDEALPRRVERRDRIKDGRTRRYRRLGGRLDRHSVLGSRDAPDPTRNARGRRPLGARQSAACRRSSASSCCCRCRAPTCPTSCARCRAAAAPTGKLLAPIEAAQEVWACGVTYLRSREAREAESSVKDVYARVYEAKRPELFCKSIGWRVAGHEQPIRVRADSAWNVPEPELTLVVNAQREIVGFCVGNDVSSRDIEGENPLYLPQAKVYNGSCALGPGILLGDVERLQGSVDPADDQARRPRRASRARRARRRSSARSRSWSTTWPRSSTSRAARS